MHEPHTIRHLALLIAAALILTLPAAHIPPAPRQARAPCVAHGAPLSEYGGQPSSRRVPALWHTPRAGIDAGTVGGGIAARRRLPHCHIAAQAALEWRRRSWYARQGLPDLSTMPRPPDRRQTAANRAPDSSGDGALWRWLACGIGLGAIMLATGLLLARRSSRLIRRDMEQLLTLASALGTDGKLPARRMRLPATQQVADALIDAAARLRRDDAVRLDAEAAIRRSNIELEHEVHERTQDLRQSRHLVSLIMEQMPAIIVVKRADNLRYEFFNRAAEVLFGKSSADIIHRTDQDLYPGAEAQARMAADRKVIDSREIVDIAQETFCAPQGTTRFLHTRKMVLLDHTGKPTHLFAISLDITETLRAAEQLRIAAVAFESHEPMMITDARQTVLRINSAFTASTGYTEQDILGHTPHMLRSGRHDDAFYAAMWDSITRQGTWQGECWDRRKNGEVYPTWTIISAIRDQQGIIRHYVCTQSDISSRKQAEEEIRQLAFYDPLTRLPNRRLLVDRLRHAIDKSGRSNLIGALMFIDLDNFKMLNDTLGHDQGDVLLREVARRLPACLRSVDTVARLGGDEFVIMLEGLSHQEAEASHKAQDIAEHILAELNRPYTLADRQYLCTSSIGVTLISDHRLTTDEVLRHADLAMYQAKAAGRNTFRFFEPRMQQAANARAEMEHDLQQALEQEQFELYYQAQVNATGQLIGAEALLRWHHPRKGLVLPDQFIELAESSDLILRLGQWVLKSACAQLATWASEPVMRHLTLAINVSPQQFKQAGFVSQVNDAVRAAGAEPQRLKLELTESLMLDDFTSIAEKMSTLKRAGVGLALDDFGTGYSSLASLKRLPLDQLKIDRSFCHDLLTDPNDAAIARVMIVLGHTLGLTVIAEGVETAEQQAFLVANQCNAFQGFLFSQPLCAREFRALAGRQSHA